MALSYEVLKDIIKENDSVLIGVSGGADSMCLLDIVDKYSKCCNFNFMAIHINHNLREDEALRDENFVKNFCEKRNIQYSQASINTLEYANEKNKTIEQAARELRYNVFDEVMQNLKLNKLLVAHHMDDQAETVLMHIARGSSIKGASGMSVASNKIFRPLLSFSRKEILDYNKKHQIPYITDSSNLDVKYARNFIRHKIIKEMNQIYPNFVKNVCLFAQRCAIDEEFIESFLPMDLLIVEKDLCFISTKINNLNYAISSRLVKKAIEQIGIFADIEEKHIKKIVELASSQNGKKINLTNKLIAYKEYENIVIQKNNEQKKQESYPFVIGCVTFENYGEINVELIKNDGKFKMEKGCHYLDFDKLPSDSCWRVKKDGDVFKKFGSGSKKLSDYMSDNKIPIRLRKNIPVLAKDNIIFFVAGFEISDLVKISNNTKNIIKISYRQE